MSQQDDLSRKKIHTAIAALKARWSSTAMAAPLTEEGENERRELVRRFQLADDIGKQIETEMLR